MGKLWHAPHCGSAASLQRSAFSDQLSAISFQLSAFSVQLLHHMATLAKAAA
jgi:hypothetical protein